MWPVVSILDSVGLQASGVKVGVNFYNLGPKDFD